MTKKQAIKLFNEQRVRTAWDDEEEKWYFSVVDVVAILTDSENPRKYWSVLKTRLKSSIEIRKDLTDQWKAHNVKEGQEYATLMDIIYNAWAGLSAKEYKRQNGLKKENLRDNMTNEELVLNMLWMTKSVHNTSCVRVQCIV